MTKNYMSRQAKTGTVRGYDGWLVQVEASDITVTRLKGGEYRCYKCPAKPIVAGQYVNHLQTLDAARMVLHVVDHHMMAGHAVSVSGLKRLAEEAVRDA